MGQAAPFFAAIGSFASAAAPWISAISSVLGVVGLFSSHKNQVQAANYQYQDMTSTANLLDISGLQEGVKGLQEKVDIQAAEQRRQARMRAVYAARGIQLEGAPEAVMYDSLTQSRRQYQAADFNSDTASLEQAARAQIVREQARNQRSAGLSTATSNTIAGASNLLFSAVNR